MILSKTCDYGIRAAIYIASCQGRSFTSIGEISQKLDISFHFLTKILQKLTQFNILKSFRGPKGGVALARSAQSITLMEIVSAIDGDAIFNGCLLGLIQCSDKNPCPLHEKWKAIRGELESMFQKTTLDELATMANSKGLRITDLVG